MALVDDVKIKIKAGDGGEGGKAFLQYPGSSKSRPDGGNGGKGGDIYFQASNNVSDLSEFRFKKEIKAQSGGKGMNKNRDGRGGEELVVLVPPGTKIINEETNEEIEIIDQESPILIAKGGHGGRGSHDYKPDINRFGPQYKEGERGEIGRASCRERV